jgi:hypothetical protein
MRILTYAILTIVSLWYLVLMRFVMEAGQTLPKYSVTHINYHWYFLPPISGLTASAVLAYWHSRTTEAELTLAAARLLLLGTFLVTVLWYGPLYLIWFLSAIGSA